MSQSIKDRMGGNIGNGAKRAFFKPEEYRDSYVMLIEVLSYNAAAVNPFYDPEEARSRPTRAEAKVDLTIFATPEDLNDGVATVLPGQTITGPYLAGDLEQSAGKVEIARLARKPNKKGLPSWVWRAAEGDVIDKVDAFYQKREAELAEALSGDEFDFLKEEGE